MTISVLRPKAPTYHFRSSRPVPLLLRRRARVSSRPWIVTRRERRAQAVRRSRDPHVDPVVVERRPPPDIGQRLRRRLIRVRAVGGELAPPDRRGADDALADAVADDGLGGEGAAVVVDGDALAGGDAA